MQGYVWYWLTALLWAVEALAGCPDDYQMHGGICYKAFDETETFLDASEICSTDGGTLAMPKDNNTNAFLISLKNDVDSTRHFRFGSVDQHEEGAWEWIDGTPVGNYGAWSPGEPNNEDDEDCAEYSPTTWNDGRCSVQRRFICQIILAGCPEGYIYHEPSRVCYKAFDDETENYVDSVAACSSDGGTLAMPRDTATNNFLIYLKNAVDNSAGFRLGLTDLHREGTWMWADNVTLGDISAWGPGEPNNYDDQDEDCAEYFPGNAENSRKNKWNDGQCSSNDRKFICQVIPTDVPLNSVGTEMSSPSSVRVMEQSSSTSTMKPEVTSNTDTTSGTTPNAAQTSSRPPVLARVNVSLTLTARRPVNLSNLTDAIRQSLEKQDDGFCGDQCQIGEIFLHIVTDTNGARKKRQAGDEVRINVIIQLIVLANQQQGDNSTVAAWNLLQEKAEALRQLARSGDLSVSIGGEQIRLVDSGYNSNNCPLGQGNCAGGNPTTTTTIIIVAAVCGVILIAIITVAGVTIRRKSAKEKPTENHSSNLELDQVRGNSDDGYQSLRIPHRRTSDHTYQGLIGRSENELSADGAYEDVKTPAEFPRDRLEIKDQLWEGEFGEVYKAEAWKIAGLPGMTTLVVKTVKGITPAASAAFLKELAVLKLLGTHPNVVSFLGCCTDTEPFYLLLEYVSGGTLQSNLRKSRSQQTYGNLHGGSKSLSSRDLTKFAWDVAKGMSFLSAKKILHRDLATRNVLVSTDQTCKVSDFGFSREGDEYERTTKTRLPIRWMAPESLFHRKYTTKTDVWAFGVLLWEIVTLGATPYPGMSKREVMDGVQQGYRMDKPKHCDEKFYTLMLSCWNADPAERPEFRKIQRTLDTLMETEHDYINLASLDENTYQSLQTATDEKY